MNFILLTFLVPMVTGSDSYQPDSHQSDNGEEKSTCKCMPYYQCDLDLKQVYGDTDNSWGTLDLRFNQFTSSSELFSCLDRMELCCQERKTVDPPKPTIKSCGYRNPKGLDFNLIGVTGTEARFGEFPWVVAILDNDTYYGAGSLIHPQVVVTAAHIVNGHALGRLKIRAGEWDTMTVKERLSHQEQLVKEVYKHEDFIASRTTAGNDMALLLLEKPIQLDEHINVICMPDQDEDFSKGKDCVANGWGKSSYGPQSQYAHVLKRVEIDIVERARCQSQISRQIHRHFRLVPTLVCAGGEEGKDTCQGDGGAPLACPIGADRYKLTGLVVAGVRCGLKDVPALYTNVAKFRQWVDNKMAAWGLDSTSYTYSQETATARST